MFKQFGVLLKKETGFERFNDSIIRKFEASGWKADRNLNTRHIFIYSNKIENSFRDKDTLVKKLKQLLTPIQLERCVLVELVKERKNKSSLDYVAT